LLENAVLVVLGLNIGVEVAVEAKCEEVDVVDDAWNIEEDCLKIASIAAEDMLSEA